MANMTAQEREEFSTVCKYIDQIAQTVYGGKTEENFLEIFELLNPIQKRIYLTGSRKTCGYLSVGICRGQGGYPQDVRPLRFAPTDSPGLNMELAAMYDPAARARAVEHARTNDQVTNRFPQDDLVKADKAQQDIVSKTEAELKKWFFKFMVRMSVFALFALLFAVIFWDPHDNASYLGKVVNSIRVIVDAK